MKEFEKQLLINPRFPSEEAEELRRNLLPLKEHIWIATSGSSSIKWTALSHGAVFASAAAVNEHLASDQNDIWLNPLPSFHVGGLGIKARGHLSGAKVIDCSEVKWDPQLFNERLHTSQASLTALVPAQLYDLVSFKLSPPASLRAVIIGGGALHEALYEQGVNLGWKLMPSYGMTECASQVATAEVGKLSLKPLSHVEVCIKAGRLHIKSPALLTCYLMKIEGQYQVVDPKIEGWFETEDRAHYAEGHLQIFGRDSSFVKIGGESCDLLRLERILEELKLQFNLPFDLALFAADEPRLGAVIHLAVAAMEASALTHFVEAFQQRVLPFERIRKVHYLEKIPRTPLSKLILPELKRLIQR